MVGEEGQRQQRSLVVVEGGYGAVIVEEGMADPAQAILGVVVRKNVKAGESLPLYRVRKCVFA